MQLRKSIANYKTAAKSSKKPVAIVPKNTQEVQKNATMKKNLQISLEPIGYIFEQIRLQPLNSYSFMQEFK